MHYCVTHTLDLIGTDVVDRSSNALHITPIYILAAHLLEEAISSYVWSLAILLSYINAFTLTLSKDY